MSDLLGRVAAEYGSDVAISEVNRIRSGGVAGFFCREEFEVIVDLRSPAPRRGQGLGPRPTRRAQTRAANPTGSDRRASSTYRSGPPRTRRLEDAETFLSTAFSDAEDFVGDAEDFVGDAEDFVGDAEDFVGDAEDFVGDAEDFVGDAEDFVGDADPDAVELLNEHRTWPAHDLDEPSDDHLHEAGVGGDLFDPTPDKGWPNQPDVAAEPTVSLPVYTDLMVEAEEPLPAIEPEVVEVPAAEPVIPAFWSKIIEARAELASVLPDDATSMACVGPLSLIMPVVSRLRATSALASSDVIVLTDRTEIVSEPEWTLVRSGNQLIEQAKLVEGRPAILLIDVPVELPNWVAPLLSRLHMSGVGLVRFAVPEPTVDQLELYRHIGNVPYVLDVMSRVPAERLAEALDNRHPIASVAGAPMSAELLVSFREHGIDNLDRRVGRG